MVKSEVSGLKILILLSGGAQISRHISKRSASYELKSYALLILFFVIELIINDKANVPADLRSAGIEYKDLFNPLKIPLV